MYYSHLVTIKQLVETYQHQQPLAIFLKSFFRSNKKFGLNDRKVITNHIYNFYRIGKALSTLDFNQRLDIANYLIDGMPTESADPQIISFESRAEFIKSRFPDFKFDDIFSFSDELSAGVDKDLFIRSIISRPRVFIRIRKGFEEKVKQEFIQAGFKFEIINSHTFSFEQEVKIAASKSFEKGWFEIQDLSSQQTGDFFEAGLTERWWDCCAGAGGKSLLFKDKFPETNLLISDRRKSILKNALERLKKTGAKNYNIAAIDLSVSNNHNPLAIGNGMSSPFDGIIIDAPCSGSGTWARAPENISFFKTAMIDEFQSRQLAILNNAIPFLKEGGRLIYITCSAFRKENESVSHQLLKTCNLKLIKEKLFTGYLQSADVMYAALFKKM